MSRNPVKLRPPAVTAERPPIPAPPYLLYGMPCPVCEYPAAAWVPDFYVDHGNGVACLFDGILGRVRLPKPAVAS